MSKNTMDLNPKKDNGNTIVKHKAPIWLTIMIFTIGAVSIYDLFMVLSFDKGCDVNKCAILIGVLAILVTLLVGWQIYSTINFKEVIEARLDGFAKENNGKFSEMRSDMESLAANLRMEISDGIKESTDSSLFISLAQLGMALHNCSPSENCSFDATSIQVLFNAIYFWNEDMDNSLSNEAYKSCLSILKEYSKNNFNFNAPTKDDWYFFMRMAIKTKDTEIIDFVKKSKINNPSNTDEDKLEE